MPTQTDFIFTIQPFADGALRYDVESHFKCTYAQMTGASSFGEVQNTYTESYPEESGVRLYTPETPTYKPVEVTLTLLFKGEDALKNSAAFHQFVAGKRVQWFDTFRRKYLALLLTKTPSIEQEKLYGGNQYQLIKYTFSNFKGYPADGSFVAPGALYND